MINSPRLRPAVRALLADPEDRVLMVRWAFRGGGGGYDGQEECFYLARVDAFTPSGALTAAQLAAEGLVEIRWMTLGEVHALPTERSGEPVFLRAGAAEFTALLVEHGHPAAPVELTF